MMDNCNIENYVDLNSYSDSLGWVGYYSRKYNYSQKLMNESIRQFTNFFKKYCPKVSILTSLYKFKNDTTILSIKQLELVRLGYLHNFSNSNQWKENISTNPNLILFNNSNWTIVRKLSSLIMNNNGDIAGHCFFLFEALNLIVYPHDDTGYGFILNTANPISFQMVNDFLMQLDSSKFMYEIKTI